MFGALSNQGFSIVQKKKIRPGVSLTSLPTVSLVPYLNLVSVKFISNLLVIFRPSAFASAPEVPYIFWFVTGESYEAATPKPHQGHDSRIH